MIRGYLFWFLLTGSALCLASEGDSDTEEVCGTNVAAKRKKTLFIDYSEMHEVGAEEKLLGPLKGTANVDLWEIPEGFFNEAQEHEWFLRYNFIKFRMTPVSDGGAGASGPALDLYRLQKKAIESVLFEKYIRLAYSIANSFVRKLPVRTMTFEEARSECHHKFVISLRTFDYKAGFRFSTYFTTSVGRALSHLHRKKLERMKLETREQDVGPYDFHITRLAPEMRLEKSQLEQAEVSERLAKAMSSLNDREKLIIARYFGFVGEPQSFEEIGSDLGITKSRAHQIIKAAYTKIRRSMPPSKERLVDEMF